MARPWRTARSPRSSSTPRPPGPQRHLVQGGRPPSQVMCALSAPFLGVRRGSLPWQAWLPAQRSRAGAVRLAPRTWGGVGGGRAGLDPPWAEGPLGPWAWESCTPSLSSGLPDYRFQTGSCLMFVRSQRTWQCVLDPHSSGRRQSVGAPLVHLLGVSGSGLFTGDA